MVRPATLLAGADGHGRGPAASGAGAGGGADGSAECAVAVVDEAAVVAHVGVGKDAAGNAEVDEVLDEGVEAGLRGGAGRGVAVPGGNVVVVETEGVPGGYGLGEDPALGLLTGAVRVGGDDVRADDREP